MHTVVLGYNLEWCSKANVAGLQTDMILATFYKTVKQMIKKLLIFMTLI